jgi:hypothetical protein
VYSAVKDYPYNICEGARQEHLQKSSKIFKNLDPLISVINTPNNRATNQFTIREDAMREWKSTQYL